ncbi:Hypothetical protein A7982_00794 [Minicystis rosea]|nr:Hypothetical protein A7982_00794 [Minicystis rosea]
MPEPTRSRSPAPAADASTQPAPPATLSRFLAEARAFDADQVIPFRADARAVQHQVGLGVASVLTWADHVREHLPHVDLDELRSLPDLALCLAHATQEAGGDGPEAAEARELLMEAHDLRHILKTAAVAAVAAGVLAPKDIAKIGADHGAVDVGADCVALGALFEKRGEDLEGRTPVTAEQIARAAEIGATLRALAKPKGAAKKPGASGLSPVEARDRLWTLLAARHERLWAVGAYVYGHDVGAHVPPLSTKVAGGKAKKTAKTEET